MARHYIGFTKSGPATFRNVYISHTGRPEIFIEEDAVTRLELDFGSWLESGETVSSATITNNNITATIVTATPLVTLTLSGATDFGEVKVEVTFSTGDVWVEKIMVRNQRRYTTGSANNDYREIHA